MPVPISHHPRGRRCYSLLLAGALALFSANPANAAPNTDPLPLEYAWGETYLEIAHELIAKKIELLEDQEGRLIRIQRSELDVRYLFYTEEKIGDIILMEREEEGERRMVLDRLVMEPAHPPEEARLYAIDVLLPGLPLPSEKSENTGDNLELLSQLEKIYGPPRSRTGRDRLSPGQSAETRRKRAEEEARDSQAARVAGFVEFRNRDTLVRVFYEEQGGIRYARRLSFQSRVISEMRNKATEKLREEADRRILKKIRAADRQLKRRARSNQ